MKIKKDLKRFAKIEKLLSEVVERYAASATHIQDALHSATAAVIRAKDVVNLHLSAAAKGATVAIDVARKPKKKAVSKKVAAKIPKVKTASKKAKK